MPNIRVDVYRGAKLLGLVNGKSADGKTGTVVWAEKEYPAAKDGQRWKAQVGEAPATSPEDEGKQKQQEDALRTLERGRRSGRNGGMRLSSWAKGGR